MNEKHGIKSSCCGFTDGKQCQNVISNTTRYCTNCGTPNQAFRAAQYDDQSSSESSSSEASDNEDLNDKWILDEQCVTTSILDALSTNDNDDHSFGEISSGNESIDGDQDDKWNYEMQQETFSDAYVFLEQIKDTAEAQECMENIIDSVSAGEKITDTEKAKNVDENIIEPISDGEPIKDTAEAKECKDNIIDSASDGEKITDTDTANEVQENFIEPISAGKNITDTDKANEVEENIIKPISDGMKTLEDEISMDIGLGSIRNEVLELLQTGGEKAVVEYLQMTTASWKSATVKIAIAGKSKSGKSSFINAIRNVDHTDETFAKEGRRGENPLDVKEYRHTKNNKIIYCELPGYGNIRMTRKTFLEKVQLQEYDIFLIFVHTVPSEDDEWLVTQLIEADIGFCFVRAKIDLDIKNAPQMGKTEKDVLIEIRKKVSSAVKDMPAIEDAKLFLISKNDLSVGEMDELVAFIEMKIPKLKFEAVLMTFTSFSNQVIEKKYQMFKDRISSLSLAIALDGDPIKYQGYFFAYSEIIMYFQAFELDSSFDPEIPNLTHRFSECCVGKLLDSLHEKIPGIYKQVIPIYNWVATYRVCKRFFAQLLDELKIDYFKMMKFFKIRRDNIKISTDGEICPTDCPCVKFKKITF